MVTLYENLKIFHFFVSTEYTVHSQLHFHLILGSHRNPSTAFYQAFHLNTFQESKSLWDRYDYLIWNAYMQKCMHELLCIKLTFVKGGNHMESSMGQSSKINQKDYFLLNVNVLFNFITFCACYIYF